MPREIAPKKVEVRNYKNKDDESASDASRIEEIIRECITELSAWTHDMKVQATD
jgi:hypothetical protein